MFRQEEIFVGGWKEKTIEARQRRRFERMVSRLAPLGAGRLDVLEPEAFSRRIERCWQNIERKPMRTQQIDAVWKSVLGSIELQADCLSREEHELVERALILGGCAEITDVQELEAALALSLRLWATVGIVSGKPYMELEAPILRPAARAFARAEHDMIRHRLDAFSAYLSGTLYRVGALDDRRPQQMLLHDVLGAEENGEQMTQLARHYLWSSFDCMDYAGGVMLMHAALADPTHLLAGCRRKSALLRLSLHEDGQMLDILPEEIPLQQALERLIEDVLRDGYQAQDVARNLRFLCKQGAPLAAMEEVLQEALIVYLSPAMRWALADMYERLPKWIECCEKPRLLMIN